MANIVYMAKSAWTGLLDTIRSKASVSGTMTVSQATTAVENIQTGGGGGDEYNSLVERTLSIATGDMSVIGNTAFRSCPSLHTASFQKVTTLSDYAFANCSQLTSLDFPSLVTVGNYAFNLCSKLSSVYLPNAMEISSSAFYSCSRLSYVELPNLKTLRAAAFIYCSNLTTAWLGLVSRIESSAFRYCYNLLSLYISASSVPTLVSTIAFASTPISTYTTSTGGVNGSIFVPASLYNSYLTATNWSIFSSRFVSV